MRMEHNRSMLEGFADCPRWYKEEKAARDVRGLGRSSGPALRGHVEHAILQQYVAHLARTGHGTDLSELESILQRVVAETPGLDAGQVAEVETDMETFATRFLPDTAGLVAIEDALRVELTDTDVVYGTPDIVRVVGPVGYLDDYKSNWRPWTQAEAEAAFQLRCYAVLVAETFGVTTVHCRYVFVKHGIERSFMLGAEDIAAARRQLCHMVAQVRTCEDWSPRPGSRCNWCRHSEGCPVAEAVTCRDMDEARAVAGSLLQLEAQVHARTKALKEFVDHHGQLEVNGEVFGYSTSRTPTVPVAAVLKTCDTAAQEYVLSVSGQKLNTKKFQAAWGEALRPYADENITTRFGHKTVKE